MKEDKKNDKVSWKVLETGKGFLIMNKEFINKYLEETKDIIKDIDREEIDKFVNILFDVWKNGKKVITMGNGGSSSNASHFSSDLAKTIVNSSAEKNIVKSKKGFNSIVFNTLKDYFDNVLVYLIFSKRKNSHLPFFIVTIGLNWP